MTAAIPVGNGRPDRRPIFTARPVKNSDGLARAAIANACIPRSARISMLTKGNIAIF